MKAYQIAMTLYEQYQYDPTFLLELGAMQIFLGNYELGHEYCTQAKQFAPRASLIYACIGVSGMYIPNKSEETISAFLQSIELLKDNSSSSEVYSPVFKVTLKVNIRNLYPIDIESLSNNEIYIIEIDT